MGRRSQLAMQRMPLVSKSSPGRPDRAQTGSRARSALVVLAVTLAALLGAADEPAAAEAPGACPAPALASDGGAGTAELPADGAEPQPGDTLFESPQGFWLAPSRWDGTLYGPSKRNANWHFTQWENPGPDLSPLLDGRSATASLRVVDRGGQWEIAQNGANLPPGDEFAAFAEANQTHVYADYRPAGTDSLPLSRMAYLHHSLGFRARYEVALDDGSMTHQGGYLTAVVLKNIENGNRFFYQLELRPVNKKPSNGWWDWSGPRWGYTDSILTYDRPIPELGERVFLHLDLLPRLVEIVGGAFNGSDPDPAHWVVTGTYHGSHVWGNVRLTSEWDCFSLHTRYLAY